MLYDSAAFLVPYLCCSFHLFAIWEGDVWGSWLFAATLRKPTALHETTRTAVSPWDQTNCCRFPDVSSSRVAWVWNHSTQKYHAAHVTSRRRKRLQMSQWPCIMIWKCFATLEHVKLVAARSAFWFCFAMYSNYCCLSFVAASLKWITSPLQQRHKAAQFFPCLDFWELFLIVLCLRRLGWSFHK